MTIREVPASVLKNKGIPVPVHALETGPDGNPALPYRRLVTQAGDPVEVEMWVRLTNLGLADLEEKWGGLQQWQEALASKPFSTLLDTLAIVWEEPRRAAGLRMIDGGTDDYSTAIGAAFMLANGVPPERVGEVIARGVRASAAERARLLDEGLREILADDGEALTASSGTSGSLPGPAPDGPSPSSGA